MMPHKFPQTLAVASFALALAVIPGCGGSSSTGATGGSSGPFEVVSSTLAEGDVWALNRPIDLVFNHPVDEDSISFNSIILKPVDQQILNFPVTGSFSLVAGSDDKVIRFTPACPTNETNSNGGFIPGNFNYTLTLPTQSSGQGLSVLRDDKGRALSIGLTRNFATPSTGEPLFIDTVLGPVGLRDREAGDSPAGLNLYSDADNAFTVRFDQPIDTSPSNLSTDRIYFLYSDAAGTSFPVTNKLSGDWLVIDNCNEAGAIVRFEASGLLPPGRKVRLQVTPLFADLSGDTNNQIITYTDEFGAADDLDLPTLNEYYGDSNSWATAVTYDSYREDFETTLNVDLDADLFLPMMELHRGYSQASFDFPGTSQVNSANDFYVAPSVTMLLPTTGTNAITDSNGRAFTITDGVLEVDDLNIEAGSSLKGEGENPLVIYATGTVNVQGTLDASGDHAQTPLVPDNATIPELGANGQCGGGNGGSSSLLTNAETHRGENGYGPFQAVNGGGGGGEGGFQQDKDVTLNKPAPLEQFLIAAGGGGGGFADGTNEAALWPKWSGSAENLYIYINGNLTQYDDDGPDCRYQSRHTALDPFTFEEMQGAEAGLRGSSWMSSNTNNHEAPLIAAASAPYGMEDGSRDTNVDDNQDKYDPIWNSGADPDFDYGHPTSGPDAGPAGASQFSNGDSSDDFWGSRVNPDGSVTVGELAGPLAGSGGGASGDMSVLERLIIGFDPMTGAPIYAPLTDSWPDPDFPYGDFTEKAFKGAPGGGGGGQMLIYAIGPIIIGNDAVIKVNGGNGAGGEAVFRLDQQLSGSGGGSGGHLVLHSSTGLDLSAIDLGLPSGATIGQIKDSANYHEVVRALGGRRGWVMAGMPANAGHVDNDPRDDDGNSDFMAGRGGAGGNGLIQIHVPNPLTDIAWHPNLESAILGDITISGVNRYANNDNLEEVLRSFCVPAPKVLVTLYSTGSQVQSKWIDTGTAGERNPVGNPGGLFLDYADSTFGFAGFDTSTGRIQTEGDEIDHIDPVAFASSGLVASSNTAILSNASTHLASAPHLLTNANLLVGFDLLPAALARPTSTFEIVSASYNRSTDKLTMTTSSNDGSMTGVTNGLPGATWYLRPKFVRLETAGVKDVLPIAGYTQVEFQGAAESSPGSDTPGTPGPWTNDPSALDNLRFFRFRVTVEMAESGMFAPSDPRPVIRYINVPFAW